MTDTKHTPGPWEAMQTICGKRSFRICVSAIDDNDKPVPICTARPSEEGESDARLIAAAPELLEALSKAADTFADIAKMIRLLGHPIAADAATTAEMHTRAAIAKAVGS